MELTRKQEEGLKIAIERYRHGEKYTCIAGYAGSGKSTLVRFIVAALNIAEENVCYATYTGKAAQVLLKKGNKNVSTLHKLLYRSIPKADGGFIRIPVKDVPYQIVIVDEVSMAPKTLMNLLFKYNCYVICLGDPFQLPPVEKKEDNGLLQTPHIFLDEIMRQALDSEIIRLSMDIREQKKIEFFNGKEAIVQPKAALNTGMLTWADQILVGTNNTRISINNQIRDLLGRGDSPEEGDKVICLKNYWGVLADNEDPLVNGTIGYIHNPYSGIATVPYYLGGQQFKVLNADFESDSGAHFEYLNIDEKMILTGEKCCDWKTEFKLSKNPKTCNIVPKEFTYGYAITCHKAQGSEWDKVLVIEEAFPFVKQEHARWLYTACTRAASRLVLIR